MRFRFAACLKPFVTLAALLAACSEPNQPVSPKGYGPRFSQTAPIGGASKITFQSNRNGNFDIFVMNADGSGVTQVTNNPLDEYLPLFSPDGSRIVFGRCSGICDIVVINADGSGERTILNDGFPGAWSPDGNRIVLGRNDGLYVINADGSGLVRVLDPDFVTDWSPDGRQLMIVSGRDGDLELYATNLDGSGVTQLTNNTCDDNSGTGWSPDGKRVAFNNNCDGDNEIFVMNADGSGVTQVTQNEFDDGGPVWSPDGTQLAFESNRSGDVQIFTMNADGSGVTQLTFDPGVINAGPHWVRQVSLSNDAFANATVITELPFDQTVNLTNATREPSEPIPSCIGGSASGRTAWYSFTPTTTGVLSASLDRFYSVVAAYTGASLAGLSEIWCRSPYVVKPWFMVQAGTTYYFQVDGVFGESGSLTFRLEEIPPPANDGFGSATAIGALPFSDAINTAGATSEPGEPASSCSGSPTRTAWYRFTPSQSGSISASVVNAAFAPVVAAYTGTTLSGLTEVRCHQFGGQLTFRAEAGTTYYLQVGSYYSDQGGSAEFHVVLTPPPVASYYFYPFDPTVFDGVQFFNNSYDPGELGFQSYQWNFGDGAGTTTAECCVTHRYAADGSYAVQLLVTTSDGRTASTSQTVLVRTHDVAITRFSVPNAASAGQTRRIEVGLSSKRYSETVEVPLFKSVPGGYQPVGVVTQSVPVRPGGRTTDFAFSYTFTADDAQLGKVTFKAVANMLGARDALPADNEAIAAPIKVSR